jgi:hypothetical protein
MYKNFILLICIILIVVSLNSCSEYEKKRENSPTNNGKVFSGTPLEQDNSELDCSDFDCSESVKKFEESKSDQERKVLKKCLFYPFVEDAYNRSEMEQLKHKVLDKDELEIRVGRGGGLTYPVWFVIRKNKDDISTYLIYPHSDVKPENLKMERIEFSKPDSGWNDLFNYLETQGSSLDDEFSLESDCTIGRDTTSMVFEIKSGLKYDFRAFETHTKSGKKLLGIFRKIAHEFEMEKEFGFPTEKRNK